MDDQSSDTHPFPFVPLNAATVTANVATLTYNENNGAFSLELLDQRAAPVARAGDVPLIANFEVGRFVLTPRAVSALGESIRSALAAYKDAMGSDLRSIAQFDASAAMPGLQSLLQSPKPPEPPPAEF